jgi:hypothetical protein
MLRLLLLLLIAFGLVKGVERGWVEFHWNHLLYDLGVPLVPAPTTPVQTYQQTS